MKITEDFIKAKKIQGLKSFSVFNKPYKQGFYFRLSFEKKNKFTDLDGHLDIELHEDESFNNLNTDLIITRYIQYNTRNQVPAVLGKISFHGDIWHPRNNYSGFLSAMQKNSHVKFEIVVNNDSNLYKRMNLVCHQLYGIVNEKRFLLFSYVGEQNEVSPVQFSNIN